MPPFHPNATVPVPAPTAPSSTAPPRAAGGSNGRQVPEDASGDGGGDAAVAALGSNTLPRVTRAADELSRTARQIGRAANSVSDNPQSFIYGSGRIPPGPGEEGFAAPGAAR